MTTLQLERRPRETADRTPSRRVRPVRAATVVITSRNRADDLIQAVDSALRQTAVTEVIVLDDASDDGSAEVIRQKFPQVRLFRANAPVGYIALRNLGNALSSNEFIVSIDDDAVFSTEDVVQRALEVFDHSRVGAVAVPFVNVNTSPKRHQQPPENDRLYLTEAYVGTAHILRRSLFLELGGYRTEFVHQGEETDFCLRLAEAGYVVALAPSPPILHFESPRRSFARMDHYGRRNDCLIVLWNVPLIFLPLQLVSTILGGALFGLKNGRLLRMLRGSVAGLIDGLKRWSQRKPVSTAVYRKYKRMKRLRRARSQNEPK